MTHKDWCGKPCGECSNPCGLDESIPCSPDCPLLGSEGETAAEACKTCEAINPEEIADFPSFSVTLPELMESRDCYVKVITKETNGIGIDSDVMHLSWVLENGNIIAFEYVSLNYPPANLAMWKDKQEYLQGIGKVGWITRNLDSEVREELKEVREIFCKSCGESFKEESLTENRDCPLCGSGDWCWSWEIEK